MMILNQIHGELACVFDDLLADTVADVGFLEKYITTVFLVGQNAPNC